MRISAYLSVQFVSPVSVKAEPFEADYEDGWKGPKVEFFSGLLLFLAVRTPPEKYKAKTCLFVLEKVVKLQSITES